MNVFFSPFNLFMRLLLVGVLVYGSKQEQRTSRLNQLRSKPIRNAAEEAEVVNLTRKLATTVLTGQQTTRVRGRKKRGGAGFISDPSSARFEAPINESRIERGIVGGGNRFGMRPLPPVNRPDRIDPRLLGRSPEGRAWALEALHPCGEWQGAGLPDTYSSSVCVFQHKGELNIFNDSTMYSAPPTAGSPTFSVHMLFPPIPEVQCLYRLRDDKSSTWSRWRQVRWPTTPMLPSGAPTHATTLTDNGYSEYRITAKGETICLDAPEMTNQGRIIVGQRAAFFESGSITPVFGTFATPVAGDVITNFDKIFFLDNEDQLVQVSSAAYQAEAKDGAYVVHKFYNPLMGYQFHRTKIVNAHTEGTVTAPEQVLFIENVNDVGRPEVNGALWTDDSRFNLASGNTLPVNYRSSMSEFGIGASPPCDMTMAEVFVVNISNGAAATVANVTGASLRIKCRMTIEAHPSLPSAAVVFARSPPLWDQPAVEAVVKYQEVQPEAYPASYNDFGTVMGKIFGFLKNWVSPIAKVASVLPIPYAGTVGEIIGAGIDTGNGFFNGSSTLG